MATNRNIEKYCPNCESSKPYQYFHHHVISSEKYIPFCKACLNAKLRNYIKSTGNDGAGLWCLLAELRIPFIKDIWQRTQQIIFEANGAGRKPDLFLTYIKILKEQDIKVEGFWQSDVMLDMLTETPTDRNSDNQINFDLNEQQKIWGKFTDSNGKLDIEAYEFLNDTFEDYTKDLFNIDINLEKRYRDLCKAELRKRKADESGDIQEIAKAQDNLKKILDMLKLSDFQNNKKSAEEKHIERLAWMIENERPAECEDLNKYRDISGFENTWKDIMRCVQNLICGSREYPNVPKGEK